MKGQSVTQSVFFRLLLVPIIEAKGDALAHLGYSDGRDVSMFEGASYRRDNSPKTGRIGVNAHAI
jgi:hypothetical protein